MMNCILLDCELENILCISLLHHLKKHIHKCFKKNDSCRTGMAHKKSKAIEAVFIEPRHFPTHITDAHIYLN